ncbi:MULTISPECIES: hypothetical protein [Haloferax]|uniref:Uncharacterized protein n=1 Tax=Haloferax marinum TaxID=2666143 RepID=A0A6A8G2P9_9EURY|nr:MULTISPECIES: hypothetical protein [Haloferax]KAB1196057.1 hypothetical protein Hfx1150_00415 [Haloferax sp. CBA1150]MRW95037.1 hypothetical protein [Haloferax marinum]
MSSYSLTALVAVFVVGVVLGGASVAFVTPTETTTSPTSSISAATGCLAPDETAPSSWVVRMPAGEQTTFAFNRTFTHETPSVRIDGTVETVADGEYVYRLTTGPDEDSQKPPSDDCTPRTTMDAVVSIPSDYESLTIVFDGEEMVTIENDGSNPLYRPLEG